MSTRSRSGSRSKRGKTIFSSLPSNQEIAKFNKLKKTNPREARKLFYELITRYLKTWNVNLLKKYATNTEMINTPWNLKKSQLIIEIANLGKWPKKPKLNNIDELSIKELQQYVKDHQLPIKRYTKLKQHELLYAIKSYI